MALKIDEIKETEKPAVQEVRFAPETERMLVDIAKSREDEEKKRNRKAMRHEDWVKLRGPLPNKVDPGYAVISDMRGNGAQIVECSMVMLGSPGSECMPMEGRERGAVLFGSLVDNITARETLVLQFTKYPQRRDDGQLHIRSTGGGAGRAIYPNDGMASVDYIEFEGTFYNKHHNTAAEMLTAAKIEAGPRRKAAAQAIVDAENEREGTA